MKLSLKNKVIFLIVGMLALAGCGYKFAADSPTLSVPYIKGDVDGLFTTAFVGTIAKSGAYQYVDKGGEYLLELAIVSDEYQQIGYRYDREERTGIRINRLEPVEERHKIAVEVKLFDRASGELLRTPFIVKATTDYDFVDQDSAVDVSFVTPSGRTRSVLDFSLGQLDSRDGARDNSRRVLFNKISEKIINSLAYQ